MEAASVPFTLAAISSAARALSARACASFAIAETALDVLSAPFNCASSASPACDNPSHSAEVASRSQPPYRIRTRLCHARFERRELHARFRQDSYRSP